ncbi:MAG: DUF424 family protein [Desulfurococcales archaeon]|nr:DUF424 family protein [Desulfurococcales archaeon]MEB3788544.1 DUF424 family protein [Desulfurococcales archaeon]
MFHISIYKTPYGTMLFAADEELVGKAFYDEDRKIALLVSEKLYGDKLVEEADLVKLMYEASVLVLTGKKTVEIAVKLGLVHPEAVLYVKNVPHAHVYKM